MPQPHPQTPLVKNKVDAALVERPTYCLLPTPYCLCSRPRKLSNSQRIDVTSVHAVFLTRRALPTRGSMRQIIAPAFVVLGFCATWAAESPLPSQGSAPSNANSNAGMLPTGKDGKPLNLNFETGTLKDWTATGDAFKGQPIKGDVVHSRRADMKSEHAGEYWIGGYERGGDKPQGTLTSVPFTVTEP